MGARKTRGSKPEELEEMGAGCPEQAGEANECPGQAGSAVEGEGCEVPDAADEAQSCEGDEALCGDDASDGAVSSQCDTERGDAAGACSAGRRHRRGEGYVNELAEATALAAPARAEENSLPPWDEEDAYAEEWDASAVMVDDADADEGDLRIGLEHAVDVKVTDPMRGLAGEVRAGDEPACDESACDESAGNDPACDESASGNPAGDKPAGHDPLGEESTDDESAGDHPACDELAGDDSAGDELTGDNPVGDNMACSQMSEDDLDEDVARAQALLGGCWREDGSAVLTCPENAEDESGGEDDLGRFDIHDPHQLGELGEHIAARYLRMYDYKILERNYRCHQGEADIICTKDDSIVLVEVKTRLGADAHPEDAVNASKLLRYKRITLEYLMSHEWFENVRLDVLAVNIVEAHRAQVHHFVGVCAWEG